MTPDLTPLLAEELALVIGALIDSPSALAQAAPPQGRQWVGTIQADDPARGTFTVAVDDTSASAATALVMGLTSDVPDQSVADMLREVIAQATSALSQKPIANGAALRLVTLEAVAEFTPVQPFAAFTLSAEKLGTPLVFAICGSIDLAASPGDEPRRSERPPAPAVASAADRIDVILDIDLPLVVRFGRTELPLKTLARLAPGSVIELGRSADDPVEVLVSNRIVARGEVVIVGGNYGVRILDVVSPRQRINSMEA